MCSQDRSVVWVVVFSTTLLSRVTGALWRGVKRSPPVLQSPVLSSLLSCFPQLCFTHRYALVRGETPNEAVGSGAAALTPALGRAPAQGWVPGQPSELVVSPARGLSPLFLLSLLRSACIRTPPLSPELPPGRWHPAPSAPPSEMVTNLLYLFSSVSNLHTIYRL